MNILGIDYGQKRVGIALSIDKVIVPYNTLQNNNLLFESIKKIIIEKKIKKVIIGKPVLLSGKEGQAFFYVKKFKKKLSEYIDAPIEFSDERFTSKIANDQLKNSKKKEQFIDQLSAVEILKNN